MAIVLMQNVQDDQERKYTMEWLNSCCTGWLIHRLAFHSMFIVNIDLFRSFNYCVSFWYSVLLLLGSVYGVIAVETALDIGTPPQFRNLHLNAVEMINGLINGQ